MKLWTRPPRPESAHGSERHWYIEETRSPGLQSLLFMVFAVQCCLLEKREQLERSLAACMSNRSDGTTCYSTGSSSFSGKRTLPSHWMQLVSENDLWWLCTDADPKTKQPALSCRRRSPSAHLLYQCTKLTTGCALPVVQADSTDRYRSENSSCTGS